MKTKINEKLYKAAELLYNMIYDYGEESIRRDAMKFLKEIKAIPTIKQIEKELKDDDFFYVVRNNPKRYTLGAANKKNAVNLLNDLDIDGHICYGVNKAPRVWLKDVRYMSYKEYKEKYGRKIYIPGTIEIPGFLGKDKSFIRYKTF